MMIVIQKSSGGVALMRLLNGAAASQCIDKWKAVNPGEYVSHTEIADDAIPADRAARDSWVLSGSEVVVEPPQ